MKKSTGRVIKTLREIFLYKQEFVATKINITTATLANIENGRVGLDLEKLYVLSQLYEIPAKDILILIIEVLEKKNDTGLIDAIKTLKLSKLR